MSLSFSNIYLVDKVKLVELFAHEKWANKELLEAAGGKPSERFIELMNHIVFAQYIWISRLKSEGKTAYSWENIGLSKITNCIQSNYEVLLELIKLQDLSATIKFKNTEGEEFSRSAIDILMHLSLHSQYHRGQIASDMSSRGIEVPGTDYIAYKGHLSSY